MLENKQPETSNEIMNLFILGDYSEDKIANYFFDADSIIIEVLVRANPAQPAGTHSIDIDIYFNTARTTVSSISKTDFVTTEALPGDTVRKLIYHNSFADDISLCRPY